MDTWLTTIAGIKDRELPFDVSKKILKRIIFEKLKVPLVVTSLLLSSFTWLGYRIYSFLTTTGGLRVIKVLMVDFQIDWDYFFESWEGFVETMPAIELRMLIINMAVMLCLGWYLYSRYRLHLKQTIRLRKR